MKYYLLVILSFIQLAIYSQVIEPDIQDTSLWKVVNRTIEPITENGKRGIRFNELPANGLMILRGADFSNGIIELDIKGSNKFQQSFVGVAFHGQDLNTYD